MDIERTYVNKLAATGLIEHSLSAGIKDTHFEDESLRDLYRFMADHTVRYKGAPSMEVLVERFPGHNFEHATDSLEYLLERFERHVKMRCARTTLYDIAAKLDDPAINDSPDGIFLEAARHLGQLIPTSKVHRLSEIDTRIETYENGGSTQQGILMGIPTFDNLTLGIQPHEFVAVVGWQGLGKSTLAQYILFNAYMQDKTCMIISLEMEWKALMRKWDTMLTHFDYNSLKSGNLSLNDVERWKVKAEEVKSSSADIIVKDDVMNCTVDFVYAEAMRYKPDLLAVDYISLMDTSRSSASQMWEKITLLTQSLKQISRTTGIPIIGVAQTNINSADGGAKLDNISYSRSIGQDSDIVLGLHQDDEMKANRRMTVRMLKNRDGATADADLHWNMENMTFRPSTDTDAFQTQVEKQQSYQDRMTSEFGIVFDPKTGEVIDDRD